MPTHCFIGKFTALEPAHRLSQDATLAWLTEAHARGAQALADQSNEAFDANKFRLGMTRRLARFGCSADQIGHRGYELPDCSHTDWARMLVYRLHERATGEGTSVRTRTYGCLAASEACDPWASRLGPAAVSGPPAASRTHFACGGLIIACGRGRDCTLSPGR